MADPPAPETVAAFVAEVGSILAEHGPGRAAYLLVDQTVTRYGEPVVKAALAFWQTDTAVHQLLKNR
jgi:hypothetical protein